MKEREDPVPVALLLVLIGGGLAMHTAHWLIGLALLLVMLAPLAEEYVAKDKARRKGKQ